MNQVTGFFNLGGAQDSDLPNAKNMGEFLKISSRILVKIQTKNRSKVSIKTHLNQDKSKESGKHGYGMAIS
jgi:multidrug resistance efflux pump